MVWWFHIFFQFFGDQWLRVAWPGSVSLLRVVAQPRRFGPGLATNSIFFCFLFCKKSLICLEGKSMTPHRGNNILLCSSQQLPRLCLVPLKDFLSWRGALQGSLCDASGTTEKQGHCQVCSARRGGPRTPSKNSWRKPWLGFCWKHTFLHRSLIFKSQQYRIELQWPDLCATASKCQKNGRILLVMTRLASCHSSNPKVQSCNGMIFYPRNLPRGSPWVSLGPSQLSKSALGCQIT